LAQSTEIYAFSAVNLRRRCAFALHNNNPSTG